MLTSGTKLGPYEILACLGTGGMGEVYRARDTRLAREVALKILPADLSEDSSRLARFEQEARSASALNHPNIITVYDIGSSGSTSYLCMELVDGRSLRAVLADGLLPLRRVVNIASQIADGLAKAHSAGIVHRDLKPENLMISKDGFLKILDFGLAKMTVPPAMRSSNLQTQTEAGMVMGTVSYMSPEQASGRAVDFCSDQFSLGTILYEMITGRHPFKRATAAETMAAIIREDPEPVGSLNPQTPAVLLWILDRCLAKDPEERYVSTRDLARDLQSIRDHISEVSSSVAIAPAVPQSARRFRFLAPVLLTGAFFLGAVTSYWFTQPKPQEPLKITTLTFSGKDSSPAVSPDGKLIAFRSERDGRSRIWLMQLAAGNEAVLTSGPDDHPRFSADGSAVFFIRYESAGSSLYRIPVVGGEERRILDDVHSADCSMDGKRIAFIRQKSGDSILFTANVDGKGIEQLSLHKNTILQYPRWSPDGKRIVAVTDLPSPQANAERILIFDVTTREQRWIRSTFPTAAAWLSARQILYGDPRSLAGTSGLAGVRAPGEFVLQDVTNQRLQSLFLYPDSSGDILDRLGEDSMVFQSLSCRENLHQISLAEKSAADRWLTQGNSTDRQPVYSQDGKRILFSSNRRGNLDLMEITVATGGLQRITYDSSDDYDPAYSPDGNHIVWSSDRSGHFEIWIAKPDGSEARQITNDGFDAENATLTPDNRWVVYNSYHPRKQGLWKIHPDGSGAAQIISGVTEVPEVSRDGKYVAYDWHEYSIGDNQVHYRVVELSTGSLVFQVEKAVRSIAHLPRIHWMPNGKAIAYLDANDTGQTGVFSQEFIPGKVTDSGRRPIAGFDPSKPTDTFSLSPDGRFITISEGQMISSLIRVENIPGLRHNRPR